MAIKLRICEKKGSVSTIANFKDCLILPIRGRLGVITVPDFNPFEAFLNVLCWIFCPVTPKIVNSNNKLRIV